MKTLPSVATTLLAGVLALLFAPDCADGPAGAEEEGPTAASAFDEARGVELTAAVWTLTWDRQGVAFPTSGGFDVDTDLGYHVHVKEARVLSHSVSFGLCDGITTARLLPGLPIRAAHAHADGADASQVETSLIEDPVTADASAFESSFAPGRYCAAHWLLARPMSPVTGPGDIEMVNRSLYLTGTFERGGEQGSIAIDTWWPEGKLVDLFEAASDDAYEEARTDGRAHHAFVTVTRHLRGLFDGIDFETANEELVTGRVIDNLVRGTTVEMELWAPGAD